MYDTFSLNGGIQYALMILDSGLLLGHPADLSTVYCIVMKTQRRN